MKFRVFFVAVLVIAALVATTVAEEDSQSSTMKREHPIKNDVDDVLLLDSVNFEPFINAVPQTFIAFVAPNCPKCDIIAPEYAAAFKELISQNIMLARVDAGQYPAIAAKYGVVGYPTILIFKQGQKQGVYNGEFTKKGFIKGITGGDSKEAEGVIFEDLTQGDGGDFARDTDGVIKLNTKNFQDFINLHQSVLVAFVSPSCGCHRLAPEFSAAARALESQGYSLVRVDATENPELARKYHVGGYPTIQLFLNGEFLNVYQGERTQDAFTNFMKGTIVTASVETEASLLAKRKFDSNTPYLVFRGPFSGSLYNRFKAVIQTSAVINIQIAEIIADESDEKVVFYQSWNEIQYTGEVDGTVLEPKDVVPEVITQLKRPLVHEWKEKEWFRDPNVPNPNPTIRVFYDGKNPESFKKAYSILTPVAKTYKNKFTFSLNEKSRYAKDFAKLQLDDSLEHPFYVHDFLLQKRYRLSKQESATAENVERMIEAIVSKTISPFWVKSEPIPETQGLIQKVVSENFHDTVWKYSRDYLLFVYEGSKRDENVDQLWEMITKVAEHARGELPEDKLAFGAIDIEKNELPDVYYVASQPPPAILLAGANSKLSPAGVSAVEAENESVESLIETLHDYCFNYKQLFAQKQKETEAKIESLKDEL